MSEITRQSVLKDQVFKPWMGVVKNPEELPSLPEPTYFVFEKDYARITTLRNKYKTELRRDGIVEQSNEKKNYDISLTRWNFERCTTEEEVSQFLLEEKRNILTSLRERNHTAESRLEFSLDSNGKLWSELWKREPLEAMYQRGVDVAKKEESCDLIREENEIKGFLGIQDEISNKRHNPYEKSVHLVISGPSSFEDTIYKENFLDFIEHSVDRETGESKTLFTRFATTHDYESYQKIVEIIDPSYFDSYKDEPIDAWYKGNPLKFSETDADSLFEKYFTKQEDAMDEATWMRMEAVYDENIDYFLHILTESEYLPVKLVEAQHNIFAEGDKELERIEEEKNPKKEIDSSAPILVFRPLQKEYFNQQEKYAAIANRVEQNKSYEVKTVSAGCGKSSSVTFGAKTSSGESIEAFISNTVASKGSQEWFNCPKCDYQADGPVGDTCPGCDLTKEEYSKEDGAVVCD